MPTKLRKLKITRVAVCEQGANPDADILLFKAWPGPGPGSAPPVEKDLTPPHAEPDSDEYTPRDYATRSQQRELWGCLWDKWGQFCDTFFDITADCDEDNVPHLPILVESIGQFQDDVASLLTDLGVVTKVAPLLATLSTVSKAGAAMAGHRLSRLKAAIEALQAIFEECTPPEIERAGISAAEAVGIPGAVNGRVPGQVAIPIVAQKGGAMPAVRKESDKEHCENCDDKDCDNPAHDRYQKQEEARMAETLDGVTKRAELAESRVKTLEARVAELEPLALKASELETTVAKMRQTPEEQEAEYLASLPDSVRKRYEADQLEKVELRKRLQEADERAEKTEYIAKTVAFRGIGMVDKHWTILKALDGIEDEETRTEVYRLLSAASEQLKMSPLFQANGTEGRPVSGGDGSGTAESQIMALAKAYSQEKTVTLDKAIEAVAREHPDLWERDQREKRFTNRVNAR